MRIEILLTSNFSTTTSHEMNLQIQEFVGGKKIMLCQVIPIKKITEACD
jgi:hypothetical protein